MQKKPELPKKLRDKGLAAQEPRHFELAALQSIDPQRLVDPKNPTRVERLFLSLALVFNDLKNVMWTFVILNEFEPTIPATINAKRGQLNGMRGATTRQAAGLLHELCELLKRERAVVEDDDFQDVLKTLRNESATYWDELWKVAIDAAPDNMDQVATTFRNGLRRVRNKAAFHYADTNALAAGYREHFFNAPKTDYNELAYYSDGNTAEGTRFYYADAAAAAVAKVATGLDEQSWSKELDDLSKRVNHALKPLVCEWIRRRRS